MTLVTRPVVSEESRQLLAREVLEACDSVDGISDGVITDPRSCDFEPEGLPRCSNDDPKPCFTGGEMLRA